MRDRDQHYLKKEKKTEITYLVHSFIEKFLKNEAYYQVHVT
jgi:hypothetical protein